MEKVNCVFDDKDFGFSSSNSKFQSEEIFKNYRPVKDANKRFNAIAEENAKIAVEEMDPKKEAHAQRIGRLFMTGSDSEVVKRDIARRQNEIAAKKKAKKAYTIASNFPLRESERIDDESGVKSPAERLFSPTQSLQYSSKPKHVFPPAVQSSDIYNTHSNHSWDKPYRSQAPPCSTSIMRSASALYHMDRVRGGKYHVTSTLDPFDEKFRVRPHHTHWF